MLVLGIENVETIKSQLNRRDVSDEKSKANEYKVKED